MATTINGRRGFLMVEEAYELAAFLEERDVPSDAVLYRHFGWVALTTTPWHAWPVPMRTWDDVYTLLQELAYTGAWDGLRDADGNPTADDARGD